MKFFVTFCSKGYEAARNRICREAELCGCFDKIIAIDEGGLTNELKNSNTFHIKKGFGHYSWKPDTIFQALKQINEGDVLVYLDSGCKIYKSKEWDRFFTYLSSYDIVGFLLHQRNYMWTRKSVFEYFSNDITSNWKESYQYGANALILRKTELSVSFVSEWRNYMITRLDLCGDVPSEEIIKEDPRLIENRYDQTILTALLYKYSATGKVKSIWEHFEGYDLFREQAFVAARMRKADSRDFSKKIKNILICIVKQYIYYPFIGSYLKRKYS